MYYYAFPGTGWSRTQIAGNGTTFSAPSVFVRSTGEADVVAQGPNDSLMYYYAWPGTTWSRTQVAGNGTTFSAPTVFVRCNGEADVVAQSDTGSLTYYYAFPGSAWAPTELSIGPNPSFSPLASAAYSPANGTLFNPNTNVPSYLDVQQGVLGDCWLLASLAEVAARDPHDIESMFHYDGVTVENGTLVGLYTVRFYTNNGTAQYVTVDTELPNGGGLDDHPVGGQGAVNGSPTPVLWVALAEKAYAEANGAGYVTTQYVGCDDCSALNGGWPMWALQAITGKPASDFNLNPNDVANAWNQGKLVVLCTPNNPNSSYIVGSHCYAVVGYNFASGLPFEVFNPWGTDSNGWAPGQSGKIYGLFNANGAFLSQNFDVESFGLGTAMDELGHHSTWASPELADLLFAQGKLTSNVAV
jgi:hypothetical protein